MASGTNNAAEDALGDVDVEQWLDQAETDHARAFAKTKRRAVMVGLIGVVWVIAALSGVLQALGGLLPFIAFATLFFGASAAVFALQPLFSWRRQARSALLTRLAQANGFIYEAEDPAHDLSAYREADLLPSYDRESLADRLSGSYRDVDLEFVHVHLQDERRRSNGNTTTTEYVTVFNGLAGRFAFHKRFSGRTLVLSDLGAIGNWFVALDQKPERVVLEDPTFEKVFEVYSTDQVEARRLLTPAFMHRLSSLRDRLDGRLQAAFVDDVLLLTVHGKRGLRAPELPLFGNLRETLDMSTFMAPIAFAHSVVDVLKLDARTQI